MRPVQIEAWALSVVDRIADNQPNEDSRVELKAEWTEAKKTARQIAGHANAARGDSILWIFGIDQKKGPTGVDHNELSEWLAKVSTEFEGIAPSFVDVNLDLGGKTAVALYIETDRSPFVIKNQLYGKAGAGPIKYEVPWREGTSTRTATRSDLVRLLVPKLSLPKLELLNGSLTIKAHDKVKVRLDVSFYIEPLSSPTVIPVHRCAAIVNIPSFKDELILGELFFRPRHKVLSGRLGSDSKPDSFTISHTSSELLVEGPGEVIFSGEFWLPGNAEIQDLKKTDAHFSLKLSPSHADGKVILEGALGWEASDDPVILGYWKTKN